MKWKWWPSIIVVSFLGCETQTSNPELKEDQSIQEKKISVDAEVWKTLEGQWREVKKANDHWRAELPCEGEGSSLIFSGKKEYYSFAQFEKENLIKDIDLSSVEKKGDLVSIQNSDEKIEVKLTDGILSLQNRFYAQLKENTGVERVYVDSATCLGDVSLKGVSSLQGEWYDAPCGSVVLQIGETEFTYREERSDILWIHPEGDNYWLTFKKAETTYGAYFVPTNDTLQLWNGRYGEWKPINLYKKSKDCAQ